MEGVLVTDARSPCALRWDSEPRRDAALARAPQRGASSEHDGLRERPSPADGRAQPRASPSRKRRGHGERESASRRFNSLLEYLK